MALTPGTRLGPYEVTAAIGAGGMGEVYRATDTALGRSVAIKVLQEAFVHDAERLARFEREARTLASLNHPNIAIIHGLEKSDGRLALVMELVEGPTLAERLSAPDPGFLSRSLAVDEALAIARQIAAALEAAHEQGIVHRDLKPANIKVRPDGAVKVLDFGLAKLVETGQVSAATQANGLSLAPTITTPAMTQLGVILGTAAYMSPEQAKGRPADKRSDIWSFGCILYEMLTGTRTFEGADVTETLADVMRVDPKWEKLPPELSPALVTFLKRCLRKDPKERVRDVGDVRLALEGAFETIVTQPESTSTPATTITVRPLWRRALPLLLTSLIVAAAAVAGTWILKPADARPVIRSIHALPEGRAFRNTVRRLVTISPDGSSLVYNGNGGLYLRQMDALGDRLIPGTESGLMGPAFSPDGQSVAFHQQGQIRRIAVTGGAAVALAPAPNPTGISWETDGTILYGQPGGLWQVSENGGEPRRLFTTEAGEAVLDPQRLPGTDWILFTLGRAARAAAFSSDIVVQSLGSGERRTIRTGAAAGRYVQSGHLIYTDGGVLYAVPFDLSTLQIVGGPVPAVEGVRGASGTLLSQFDISDNGTLVYVPGPVGVSSDQFSIVEADRAGTMTPSKTAPGRYVHVRASRDGARLAIDTDDGKEAIVYTYDVGGASALKRLTFSGRNRFPIWSPDGQRIAFQSNREGDLGIFVQRVDGTGVQRLTKPEQGDEHVPESWSLDGKYISFSVMRGSTYSVWVLSIENGRPSRFTDVESIEPTGSVFSPDGRWIAFHSRPQGSDPNSPSAGVFVEPFPATGARYQAPRVSLDFQPVWSSDGTELFYIPSTASGRLAAVRVTTKSGVTFGTPDSLPFLLTAGRLSNATRAFDVLPNGKFVGPGAGSNGEQSAGIASEVRLVFNWHDELKRVVPISQGR